MTYGEYHYQAKNNVKLKNGVWVMDKPNGSVPPRMSREDAAKYYTMKFREYWKTSYKSK